MNDILIIGGGIAGITAAIYTKRAGFSPVILENGLFGGQILSSYDVGNYPAMPNSSGFEIGENLKKQINDLDIKQVSAKAVSISVGKNCHTVETNAGKKAARVIIIASGCKPRKLGCIDEDKFIGKGVSRCVLCDGNLFSKKNVAVIGGGNSAFEEAVYLSKICSKVFLVHRRRDFRAEKNLVNQALSTEKIKLLTPYRPHRILGGECVSGIELEHSETGEKHFLSIDGIFTAVGQTPNTDFCSETVKLNSAGFIETDENCRTNISGIFAAGDCREKMLRQLVTAASDGAVAAYAAAEFLEKR